ICSASFRCRSPAWLAESRREAFWNTPIKKCLPTHYPDANVFRHDNCTSSWLWPLPLGNPTSHTRLCQKRGLTLWRTPQKPGENSVSGEGQTPFLAEPRRCPKKRSDSVRAHPFSQVFVC